MKDYTLKNDVCSCNDEINGCEECTCWYCGEFLHKLDDRICDNCIETHREEYYGE